MANRRKTKTENENVTVETGPSEKTPLTFAQQVTVGLTEDNKLHIEGGDLGYGPLTYILSRALFFVQAHELNAGAEKTNG